MRGPSSREMVPSEPTGTIAPVSERTYRRSTASGVARAEASAATVTRFTCVPRFTSFT